MRHINQPNEGKVLAR